MKILFVTMDAFENNSSATIQNKGIIQGLAGLRYKIDTLTLRPNQNAISYDDSMNDINNLIENFYYIDINPLYAKLMAKKQNSEKAKSNINKVSNISIKKFALKKVRYFIKNLYDKISVFDAQKSNVKEVSKVKIDYSKYDIIISSSDPKSSHLLVERIFRENDDCNAKWIQYWGDPMLNDITRKSDWRDGWVKYHEKKLISKADRVVYASPLTLKKQQESFPKFSFKMDYASQVYAKVQDKNNKNTSIEKDTLIMVGYFGAYQSKVRNIMPLYNSAKYGNFKLNICGHSDIVLESTKNVSIQGMLSYKKAVQMEQDSDVLVCICNSKGTQIPGKIYYCTSYKKPIIVILDSEYKEELRTYLESFNRFILCENEEDSIRDAIEKAKVQLKVREFKISEQLTPEYMAKKILMK